MPGGIETQLLQIKLDTQQAVLDSQRQAEDAMRTQADASLAAIGARALAEARMKDLVIGEIEKAKDLENKARITAAQGGEAEDTESPVDALDGLFTPINAQRPEAGVNTGSGLDMLMGIAPGSQGGGPQVVQEGKTTAGATPGGTITDSIDFGTPPERTQTFEESSQTNIPANSLTGVTQQRSRRMLDQPNVLTPGQVLNARVQAAYYDRQLDVSNRRLNYEMLKGAAELDIQERDLLRKTNLDLTKLGLERQDLFTGQLAKVGMLARAGSKKAQTLYDAQIAGLDPKLRAEVERRTEALRADEMMGNPISVYSPELQGNILLSPLQVAEKVGKGEAVLDAVTGGKKLSLTTPDGLTFEMGPDNAGHFTPGTALQNEIIRESANTIAKMQRVQGLMASTKSDYFGWVNRGSNEIVSGLRKAFPGAVPRSVAEGAADYQLWKANNAKDFNQAVFEQGGKALTATELKRGLLAELNPDMDDVTYFKVMERNLQTFQLALLRQRIVATGMLADPDIVNNLSKSRNVNEFYDNYFGLEKARGWYEKRVELTLHRLQERNPALRRAQAQDQAEKIVQNELGVLLVDVNEVVPKPQQ